MGAHAGSHRVTTARRRHQSRHAQALIDLHGLDGRPLAAMRAHALAVHDALTLVAGEGSLRLAVWFEDGLSTR